MRMTGRNHKKTEKVQRTKLKCWKKRKGVCDFTYQIRLGRVSACVGLPEAQTSISINDTKLHKNIQRAGIRLYKKLSWSYSTKNILSAAPPVFGPLPPGNLYCVQVF